MRSLTKGHVWQRGLFDTLLAGQPIPLIELNVIDELNKSIEDGQQRIKTIQAILNDCITVSDDVTRYGDEYTKWIGYHFNESKKIVAYTLTIRQSSTNDVPGQWVVEGANDKNADNVLTAYEDRSIDRTGWVVLDSSNMFESMYTMNDNDWIPFSSKYPRISGTGKLDFDYAKGDLLEELSITQGQISKLSQQNVGYAFDTHLIHEGIETTVQWTVDQDYNPSGQQYSNHKMIGFSHGYNKGDNKNES